MLLQLDTQSRFQFQTRMKGMSCPQRKSRHWLNFWISLSLEALVVQLSNVGQANYCVPKVT